MSAADMGGTSGVLPVCALHSIDYSESSHCRLIAVPRCWTTKMGMLLRCGQ